MRKQVSFIPLKMMRDLAKSQFDESCAYKNQNLRLVTDEATSKMVMTNERGPLELKVYFGDATKGWKEGVLKGEVLGTATIGEYLVVFTHEEKDRIYRVQFDDEATDGVSVKGKLLHEGDMGFDMEHPIETLAFYEAEDIQKVYWTDGINQPRMINIKAASEGYTDKSFDFSQEVSGRERIWAEREDNGVGKFPGGVVQYAFSYYNKYAVETGIVGITPVNYIADERRGVAPDETVGCNFRIEMEGLSGRYDGVRLYSIIRTSEDGTPVVKRVADLPLEGRYSVSYIDTNRNGEDVEGTSLLYLGAKEVRFETMAQKDNTLFYGNIKEKHRYVPEKLRESIEDQIVFGTLGFANEKGINLGSNKANEGQYAWEPQLGKSSSMIKYFKQGEVYRFGLQFMDKYGNWSEVVRLKSGDEANGNDFYQGLAATDSIAESYMAGEDMFGQEIKDKYRWVAVFKASMWLEPVKDELEDYIAVRPVMVMPENADRNTLAQGILTPTVYNLEDRVNGDKYGQMSWFSRPICGYEQLYLRHKRLKPEANQVTDYSVLEFRNYMPLPPTHKFRINFNGKDSSKGYLYASNAELVCSLDGEVYDKNSDNSFKTVDYTRWANVYPVQEKGFDTDKSESDRATQLRSEFFVDQTVETFHSPEVEFNDYVATVDKATLKMRIVGVVPLTHSNEGIYYERGSVVSGNYPHNNPYRMRYRNARTESKEAFRQVTEYGGIQGTNGDGTKYWGTNRIYPWHCESLAFGELDDLDTKDTIGCHADNTNRDRYKGSNATKLRKKTYDTIKFSYDTLYFREAIEEAIDEPAYFNTSDSGLVEITVDGEEKVFSVNVDKEVVPNVRGFDNTYKAYYLLPGVMEAAGETPASSTCTKVSEAVEMRYKGTTSMVVHLRSEEDLEKRKVKALPRLNTPKAYVNDYDDDYKYTDYYNTKETAYRWLEEQDGETTKVKIKLDGIEKDDSKVYMYTIGTKTKIQRVEKTIYYGGNYAESIKPSNIDNFTIEYDDKKIHIKDITSLKDKDDEGEVEVIKYQSENRRVNLYKDGKQNKWFLWDYEGKKISGMTQSEKDCTGMEAHIGNLVDAGYGFFYMAELYRDGMVSRYGGDSEEAVAANNWMPCGESVGIREADGSLKDGVVIEWTEGDTYYQRYDNLHTYPYTEDDKNQIVDIVSFMCETHINIDGRYDKHRGLDDNSQARPMNFNYVNPVYSQKDDYFQYRAEDYSRVKQSEHPVTVAWSKVKTTGEIVDTFMNVTLASVLDLDGEEGPVRALRVHGGEVYCFQDSGISKILYNQQQTVTTDSGLPLEIANSDRVSGSQRVSSGVGCHNKWSIAEGMNGLYFMDDSSRGCYLLTGDKVSDLGSAQGFRSWFKEHSDMRTTWDPVGFRNIRGIYDRRNEEVVMQTEEEALSFNELIGGFSSFYSYAGMFNIESVRNHNIIVRGEGGEETRLYEHNAGRYNNFFGEDEDFYTELIVNGAKANESGPWTDKTWTNVSFQFDSFEDAGGDGYVADDRFDTAECWTEYQHGATAWRGRYPGVAKKFRMWHADLPRDGYTEAEDGGKADRLRNPWLKVRLTKRAGRAGGNKGYRSVIHRIDVGFIE